MLTNRAWSGQHKNVISYFISDTETSFTIPRVQVQLSELLTAKP